ncbi:hypothetical protein H8D36_02650 [archaeon]|nr:hypothetical protein [archaeon]
MKTKLTKKTGLMALIVFLIMVFLITFPVFQNIDKIGGGDWDQHLFFHESPRKSILEFQQIPLWTAHYCAGNISLAHPESPFLTPMYLFIVIFGSIIGIKIQIIVYLFIGMVGMYLLSKHYNLKGTLALIPPIIFMGSSVFSAHIYSGVTMWFSMAFFPFIFLFFLKSYEKPKFIFLSGLFFALIIFSGASYPFLVFSLFIMIYAIIDAITLRNFKPIKMVIILLILFVLISAIKFIPEASFINERASEDGNWKRPGNAGYTVSTFLESLTVSPEKIDSGSYEEIINGIKHSWFDNTQYISILGLVLAIIGMIFFIKNKQYLPLFITLIIFIIISFGEIKFFNLWGLLHKLPFYSSMNAPPRVNMILVFILAIFAGKGLQELPRFIRSKKMNYIINLIVVIALIVNLVLINNAIFQKTFNSEIPLIEKSNNFYQVRNYDNNSIHPLGWSLYSYPYLVANKGVVNCYEKVLINPRAIDIENDNYKGEAYLERNGDVQYTYWSPNKLVLEIDTNEDNILIINQNFHKGWKSHSNSKSLEVKETQGLISTNVEPDNKIVTFYYIPNNFIMGSLITIITLAFIIINTRRKWT